MPKKLKQTTIDKDSKKSNFNLLTNKEIEPNVHLLHLAVLRQLTNKRAGTAKVKTRAEVRGGGKKPWAQKGTGRARVGSIRSPLWVGGGVSHGPKPRSYKFAIPKKARALAASHALVLKKDEVTQVKTLPDVKDGKTKTLKNAISSMNLLNKTLLFIASSDENEFTLVKRASNNLKEVELKDCVSVGAYDILKANHVIITDSALKHLSEKLQKNMKKGGKVT